MDQGTATYDGYGRVMQESDPIGNYRLTSYDGVGRLDSVRRCSVSGGRLAQARFGYDEIGRPNLEEHLLFTEDDTNSVEWLAAVRGYDAYPGLSEELVHQRSTWSGEDRVVEDLELDRRGLRRQSIRGDLGGAGWAWTLDAAGRMMSAEQHHFSGGGEAESTSRLSSAPSRHDFSYDAAQNLTSMSRGGRCGLVETDLSPDASGRNRPGEVGGDQLAWDAAGRLTHKRGQELIYDDRDRLVEVKEGGAVLASYGYDAQDRRIERTVGGVSYRTVWSGWRPIEEYEVQADGSEELISRRVYGVGLDEILRLEQRLPGSPPESLTTYYPLYDATSSLVALLDETGKPVERYQYSPCGERFIRSDSTAPEVSQVRLQDGLFYIDLSEPVREAPLWTALNTSLKLENLTQGVTHNLEMQFQAHEGRQARRHLVLSPAETMAAGDQLRLTFPVSALEDPFANTATGPDVVLDVTWQPAGLDVALDTSAPRIEQMCLLDRRLVIDFSEAIDATKLGQQLIVNGSATTWNIDSTGLSAELSVQLSPGEHTLSLGTGPLDLADQGLVELPEVSTITVSPASQSIYSAPFAGETTTSAVGNAFGFHGLHHDDETRLVCVRHRYLDPELGRFTSVDPYGYADGPSMYQFALNNPVSFGDPTGEIVESAWDAASLSLGLGSLAYNLIEGNFGFAALDTLGVVADAAATATPFLPGGVGVFLRASRAAGSLRKAQLVDQTINISQGLVQGGMSFAQGDYGWAAFYGGMSALGVRQMHANPFELRAVGAGSNGGNIRIVPRSIGPSRDPGGLTVRAGRDELAARGEESRQILTQRVYPELGKQELTIFDFQSGTYRSVMFEPRSFGSSFRGPGGRYVKQPDLVDLRPLGELKFRRGDIRDTLIEMQKELEMDELTAGVRNANNANNIADAMAEWARAKVRARKP